MGRPKVADSDRRRASAACALCRSIKKKCSGTAPCSHCERRGNAASCVMLEPYRRQTSREAPLSSITKKPQRHAISTQASRILARSTRKHDAPEEICLPVTPARQCVASRRPHRTSEYSNAEQNPLPRPRMLMNLRGERGTESLY